MFLFFYLRLFQNLDLFGNNNRSFSFSFFCLFVSLFSPTQSFYYPWCFWLCFKGKVPELDQDVSVFFVRKCNRIGLQLGWTFVKIYSWSFISLFAIRQVNNQLPSYISSSGCYHCHHYKKRLFRYVLIL